MRVKLHATGGGDYEVRAVIASLLLAKRSVIASTILSAKQSHTQEIASSLNMRLLRR